MPELVAFYSLLRSEDGKAYMGAILVTDSIGKPEEFRVTFPVKPTQIQERLYGESLFTHIGIELCGKPLYAALKAKPALLLVGDHRLLPLGKDVQCSVGYVAPAGEKLQLEGRTRDRDTVKSASGRFRPLSVECPSHYIQEDRQKAMSLIGQFFEHIDLTEPFTRITLAVKELAAQDDRFA